MFALLTLTIERFLAPTYPFFRNRSHEKKTCTFSGIFDDHNSEFAASIVFLRENN
jgi:hypothetical protein